MIGSSPVEVKAVEAADDTVGCSSTEVVAVAICCPSVGEWKWKRLVRPPMISVGRAKECPLAKVYLTDWCTWVE